MITMATGSPPFQTCQGELKQTLKCTITLKLSSSVSAVIIKQLIKNPLSLTLFAVRQASQPPPEAAPQYVSGLPTVAARKNDIRITVKICIYMYTIHLLKIALRLSHR